MPISESELDLNPGPHHVLAVRCCIYVYGASQVVLVVKNLPPNAGDIRDVSSVPGWGRSPGGGNGHPLQYSCLVTHMDRGAWRATVLRVAKSQIRPK